MVTETTSFFVDTEIAEPKLFFLVATLMFSSKNFSNPDGSIKVSSEGRDKFTEKVWDFFVVEDWKKKKKRERGEGKARGEVSQSQDFYKKITIIFLGWEENQVTSR